MQNTIATYLQSTYNLIQCAFPQGIVPEYYFPLLSVLYPELSDRHLAEVMAYCTQKSQGQVLNDIYAVQSTVTLEPKKVTEVKAKLLACGYEEWLAEDD